MHLFFLCLIPQLLLLLATPFLETFWKHNATFNYSFDHTPFNPFSVKEQKKLPESLPSRFRSAAVIIPAEGIAVAGSVVLEKLRGLPPDPQADKATFTLIKSCFNFDFSFFK